MKALVNRAVGLLLILAATQCQLARGVSMNELQETLNLLSRQLMTQQFATEERIRSEGHSGLKRVRLSVQGTKSYHADTHSSKVRTATIHDHANYPGTVGLGEFIAVLNGVEFRTRHNDYSLVKPHSTSSEYHSVEPIPLPEVPPEVNGTLEEQITEMRAWFKAWQDQDHSLRDYRKYFKPVLCYLEGAWTTSTGRVEESFCSDRHHIDAHSWLDLQDKISFTSYTGDKDRLENYAYLPTKITAIVDGKPVLAQWNYRILCHPTKNDLPLNRLRMVDEVSTRMRKGYTLEELAQTRAARYQVNTVDSDTFVEGTQIRGFLDDLMGEIPGKDNYQAIIYDKFDGSDILEVNDEDLGNETKLLNTGYYHRWFSTNKKDALGVRARHRGFNDENMFVALNTQEKVSGMSLNMCEGKGMNRVCETITKKVSYAIPLEIIYLTPLSTWNPLNIEYKGSRKSPLGLTVKADNRDGGKTLETAFNGSNDKIYFFTPSSFFAPNMQERDEADTSRSVVGVLDSTGNLQLVRATGIRVFFPEIPGLSKPGFVRQRYPIFPVYGEGSSVWKELDALKDIVLQPKVSSAMFREEVRFGSGSTRSNLWGAVVVLSVCLTVIL